MIKYVCEIMSKQQYALVPIELLKHLSIKDGVDEPITDPKEIAEIDETINKAEKEGKVKTYTKSSLLRNTGYRRDLFC